MYNKITKKAAVLLEHGTIVNELLLLPKWKVIGKDLVRQHSFKDFETTWSFLNKVAMRSHLWGHHPNINTTYNKIEIRLTTHDVSGISDIDIKMARRFEKYLNEIDKISD